MRIGIDRVRAVRVRRRCALLGTATLLALTAACAAAPEPYESTYTPSTGPTAWERSSEDAEAAVPDYAATIFARDQVYQETTAEFVVTNTGKKKDTFLLQAQLMELRPSKLTLGPGESSNVTTEAGTDAFVIAVRSKTTRKVLASLSVTPVL